MLKRQNLAVPVIGVAKSGGNLEQLEVPAKESLEKHNAVDVAAEFSFAS